MQLGREKPIASLDLNHTMEDQELPENSKLDEEVDEQVEKFATEICKWIYERFPEKHIEFTNDGDMALSSDHTRYAREMYVSTDLGTVRVVPDFRKRSAAAMVINMGLVNAMLKEGYDYDYISTEGKIYSDPVPFKESTVDIFGYYLTHKLNLAKP